MGQTSVDESCQKFCSKDARLTISSDPVSLLRTESLSETPSAAKVPSFQQGICLRSTRTLECPRFAGGSISPRRFAASFCEFAQTNLPASIHSNSKETLRRPRAQRHGSPCILFDTAPRRVLPVPPCTRRPTPSVFPSLLVPEREVGRVRSKWTPGKRMRPTHSRISPRRLAHSPAVGNVYAIYSPEYGPPLTATTMYCLPFTIYVIGDPLCGAGMYTAPTSFPVALS